MLFCNRWYQESAGRVYFNMSREKTRSHARHAARSTALVQTWIDQPETLLLFFAETNEKQILLQGSPELLIPLLYMPRRALGRDWMQNVKLFPAGHAQMIIWIFPESLRSLSPSPSSLLEVPIYVTLRPIYAT